LIKKLIEADKIGNEASFWLIKKILKRIFTISNLMAEVPKWRFKQCARKFYERLFVHIIKYLMV
jgi:hypothetical protein